MKVVSFKVAEALKKAGYPQKYEQGNQWCYENGFYPNEDDDLPITGWILLPTYFDVLLWLWRKKGVRFEMCQSEWKGEYDCNKIYCNITNGAGVTDDYTDPEEAIIELINFLADNKLI